MKKAFVFMADGFEEIEALATVDILRRGGISTRMVSNTESLSVAGAHGIAVQAEIPFSAFVAEGAAADDILVFPGGLPGAQHLADNGVLMDIMRRHDAEGGLVAAICAAPGLVVAQLDTLQDKKFTCYTGFEPALLAKGAVHTGEPAVISGNLVTGRGPGCAIAFGLAILQAACGKAVAQKVSDGMLVE